MAHEVILTDFELRMAAEVGFRRLLESRSTHQNRHGLDERTWDIDIEGACGELAFAKATGKYWNGGVGTYKLGDVGQFQIRTSTLPGARLIVRDNDSYADVFVLVTGKMGHYTIHGYIRGEDAKDNNEWRTGAGNGRAPAWFVPQEALKPLKIKTAA